MSFVGGALKLKGLKTAAAVPVYSAPAGQVSKLDKSKKIHKKKKDKKHKDKKHKKGKTAGSDSEDDS